MTLPEHPHAPQPDVVAAMRGDLADWRQWLARLISRWIARPLYAALAQAIVARARSSTLQETGALTGS